MSFLKGIFGGKGGKEPSPEEAIQKLRETEEMLQKKSDFLEKKVENEIAIAKKNGMKNKRGMIFKLLVTSRFQFDRTKLVEVTGTYQYSHWEVARNVVPPLFVFRPQPQRLGAYRFGVSVRHRFFSRLYICNGSNERLK